MVWFGLLVGVSVGWLICRFVGLVWFLPVDLLLSLPCLLLHPPGVDPADEWCVQVGRVVVGNR